MMVHLNNLGYNVNRKKVQKLYIILGLEAIYPKPKTTIVNQEHKKFPYLLRGLTINRVNQVYAADITYIRIYQGFIYLVAIMDWYSRYVLNFRISNSLDADFCIEALQDILAQNYTCDIFNVDQGVQFTSMAFTDLLLKNNINVSMDGKGRWADNVFVERLWRSLKYECVYLNEFISIKNACEQIAKYFDFYNNIRPHQSLNYKTPKDIFTNKFKLND